MLRDCLLWLFVLAVLYLNPPFLTYDHWKSVLPGLTARVSGVEPMQRPPGLEKKGLPRVDPDREHRTEHRGRRPSENPRSRAESPRADGRAASPEEDEGSTPAGPSGSGPPSPGPAPDRAGGRREGHERPARSARKAGREEVAPLPPARRGARPGRAGSRGLAVGDSIDGYHGVAVYYNGSSRNVLGRHIAPDGYNLGLKYQCVEFVKRYYYQHLGHKMPNPWGHARDFFHRGLADGQLNADRNLYQFTNPGRSRPQADDILVFRGRSARGFGHVAIVTRVDRDRVYIIQQNAGAPGNSRRSFRLTRRDGKWTVRHPRILGWLRKGERVVAP